MAQKILLVEDNSALSEFLSFYLHSLGYETSWAGTSAQGITKALAEVPDLYNNRLKPSRYDRRGRGDDTQTRPCYLRHSNCRPYGHGSWGMEKQSAQGRRNGVFDQARFTPRISKGTA